MSIKSLLQLILLLLIFIIIGGIYFLYFYSGSSKKEVMDFKNLNKIENDFNQDQEILEENSRLDIAKLENKKKAKKIDPNKTENEIKNITTNQVKEDQKKLKNFTKDIEYVATNKNGDVYKVLAKYGKTNIDNNSILNLEEVRGSITSKEKSKIYISSDYANYNYANQESEFYSNVVLKYDKKEINCDNLELLIDDDVAIAYNNVVVKDDDMYIKAQKISFNLVTKEININSNDKVEIKSK